LIILSFYTLTLFGQPHPSCDGFKYKADLFPEVLVEEGIKYGENFTYNGNFKELFFDIYQPVDNTWSGSRPLIILAFGGSFITGNRTDLDFLCRSYASKGYAVATIDYRLYDALLFPLPTAEIMIDVVTKAVADFKAAVRYFKEDAATDNIYNIDPDLIFVGGISAGAIAAAHAAAMDTTDVQMSETILDTIRANGGIDGMTNDNYDIYDSEVAGFINFSGGLHIANWLDENDPPFFSVHEDGDGTVPYGAGAATIFGFEIISMDGSAVLKEVGDSLGIKNDLFTFVNADTHVDYFLPGNVSTDGKMVLDLSAGFLYDLICEGFTLSLDDTKLAEVVIGPNPTNGYIHIQDPLYIIRNIKVFNHMGSLMKEENSNTNGIDLSGYPNGIYFIELSNGLHSEIHPIILKS
jgi:hypothetical protein